MTPLSGRHRRRLLAAAVVAVAVGGLASVVGSGTGAGAATLLGDDFEDGDSAGWSKSGGDWSVQRDGSLVLRQAKADSELARQFRGSADWTDYAVQARVRVTTGTAGIAARASGSTTYVRLVVGAGRAELQSVRSGRVTALGSAAVPVGGWAQLRLEVTGDQARGSVDGLPVGTGSGIPAAGRVGLLTAYGSAAFDDVVVSSGGSGPTPGPTGTPTVSPTASPSRTPTPGPTGSPTATSSPSPSPTGTVPPMGGWPTPTGSVRVDRTIEVTGAFDGGLRRYSGIGDGGQSESQDPMFTVADGGSVSNVVVGAPAGDGIHCLGRCTLRNVWWEDVGEDAATFLGSSASATMLVEGGGARSASDKVFQHNGAGTLTIRGFQVQDFGKLYRSCGNCRTQYRRSVVVEDVQVTAPGKVLVGINTNYGDTARLTRVTILGDPSRRIGGCDRYTGNNTGVEPPKTGSGPDGTYCRYTAADLIYH